MLKSMTAFGRARAVSSDGALDITAEIKSVNSRYLDCTVKLPRMYGFLEEKIKAFLSEAGIVRGKVEVYIGIDVIEQRGLQISLDKEAAGAYIAALELLRDTFGLHDDISVMSVAGNRDIFTVKKPDDDMERDWLEVRTVLASAAKIAEISANDIAGYPAKLETRIKQLLKDFDVETTEQRILTEAAIYADKAAIDEELVRLSSHFEALDEIVNANEAFGRKLDFLLQEINREVNTIGSKAANAEIAHLVVDMKTELEKIREQIQNLE